MSLTGGVYSERARPHPSASGWLTGWLNDCLTDNQCKVSSSVHLHGLPFFPIHHCSSAFWWSVHCFCLMRGERHRSYARLDLPLYAKMFCITRKWIDIHWRAAMPFPLYVALSLFCAFSLSFCIALAGRCYQCSYCQGWKSRGAHETPWQWAHASPSVGFLRDVCLCVCDGWRTAIRPLCVWEAPPPLSSHIYSPVFSCRCWWHKRVRSTGNDSLTAAPCNKRTTAAR